MEFHRCAHRVSGTGNKHGIEDLPRREPKYGKHGDGPHEGTGTKNYTRFTNVQISRAPLLVPTLGEPRLS